MEFTEFHNWVYKEIGLSLNSYKPTQLNRRIGNLMERVGVKTLEEYTKLLKEDAVEREKFMDHITINVIEIILKFGVQDHPWGVRLIVLQ